MRAIVELEVMYAPGPGDPETWGPCTGHPHDPRTNDEPDEITNYLDGVREWEQMARAAHARGDYYKAWRCIQGIKAELEDV